MQSITWIGLSALATVGVVTVPQLPAPVPAGHTREVRLTGADTADSPLGSGTALVMLPSGNEDGTQTYLDAVDKLYLEPRGFTGTTQFLHIPNGLYPITGVQTLPVDTSFDQDEKIIDQAIMQQIDGGHVDAANPVVVFGWSQSADIAGRVMQDLAAKGVPSDDVHFVLVGNADNPNEGILQTFDVPAGTSPTIPSFGITFQGATPSDLYPTDIYTNEYDFFGDFPRYPLNLFSDINAALGIAFDHITYPVLEPGQIQNATLLPGSEGLTGEGLTNYYMIPDSGLPILDVLRFIPIIGQPLYDLLEPDMRILVNLGYGSITDGWNQGPADVPTTFGFWPTDINLGQLFNALFTGAQQGIENAIKDLFSPANYDIGQSILQNPLTNQLIDLGHVLGFTDATNLSQLLDGGLASILDVAKKALGVGGFFDFPISDATLFSSPTDIINDLTGTVSADLSTVLPLVDTVIALASSLPNYDIGVFFNEISHGDLLGAIGLPIAADVFLIPLAIGWGVAPVVESIAGTAINLIDLIPGVSTFSTSLLGLVEAL